MNSAEQLASIHDCLSESLLDLDGEHAGTISDLLVNRRSGRIEFVRVAVAEQDGKSPRYIAVPWSALRVPEDDSQPWAVQARRATLSKMARFEVSI